MFENIYQCYNKNTFDISLNEFKMLIYNPSAIAELYSVIIEGFYTLPRPIFISIFESKDLIPYIKISDYKEVLLYYDKDEVSIRLGKIKMKNIYRLKLDRTYDAIKVKEQFIMMKNFYERNHDICSELCNM